MSNFKEYLDMVNIKRKMIIEASRRGRKNKDKQDPQYWRGWVNGHIEGSKYGFDIALEAMAELAPPDERVKELEAQQSIKQFPVMIECPECHTVQGAIVENTPPFGTFIHHCTTCKYVIMESEWREIPPTK